MSDWLKNLKVGDKVFMEWRGGTSLQTVEKITPKGNIKVGNVLFNANGRERGGDAWNKYYLSEATPEAINSFKTKLTIKKAFRLMRETKEISLEQAKVIISLLDTPTEKEGEQK